MTDSTEVARPVRYLCFRCMKFKCRGCGIQEVSDISHRFNEIVNLVYEFKFTLDINLIFLILALRFLFFIYLLLQLTWLVVSDA